MEQSKSDKFMRVFLIFAVIAMTVGLVIDSVLVFYAIKAICWIAQQAMGGLLV